MVARGHGLDTLSLYLDMARVALIDLVVMLGLPTPHDRPHRKAGGRNPWSPGDVGGLIELWMEGWRAASLAEHFGRSPGAIWSKARQLGLPARDRKSLVRPADPHARRSAPTAQCGPLANATLATLASDASALPAGSGNRDLPSVALVQPSGEAAPPGAAAAAQGSAERATPGSCALDEAAFIVDVPTQDGISHCAPVAQVELPAVVAGVDLCAPGPTGRRAIGQVLVEAQGATLLPLQVPLLVAELAAAKPNVSAAVKAVRKHLLRVASDPLAPPAIRRRIRQDGRIECDWVPAADLDVGYRHLGGQHDIHAAAALGLSVSCIRTRKWLTETPHQIRGQTVEEFNPAWAEETIDAWGLRLQQCHAYRDIKGVEFWFWARNGDGRIFSKRAKSKLWFRERASSGDFAY